MSRNPLPRWPFLFCVVIVIASTKLSGQKIVVQHSSYSMSKFEHSKLSEHEEMAGNIICDEQE